MTRIDIKWNDLEQKYQENIHEYLSKNVVWATNYQFEKEGDIVYFRYATDVDRHNKYVNKYVAFFNPDYIDSYRIIDFKDVPFPIYTHYATYQSKNIKYIFKTYNQYYVVMNNGHVDR